MGDRNEQLEHINRTAEAFLRRGQPVDSVDTKKKELVGDFKNGEWQLIGQPEPVRGHDFIDKQLGSPHRFHGEWNYAMRPSGPK